MKSRLLIKLITAMGIIVLIGGIVSALIIGIRAKNIIRGLVRENDLVLSQTFSQLYGEYYRVHGGWEGIDEYLDEPASFWGDIGKEGRTPQSEESPTDRKPMGPIGERGHGMMGERGRGPMMNNRSGIENRNARPYLKMLLTDEEGNVRAHTLSEELPERSEVPEKIGKSVLENGTPILVENRVIGYLFVGSMVEAFLGGFESEFLSSIYRSIALSTILVVLFAFAVATVFFRHIMKPLEGLKRATIKMGRGEYDIRLESERNDELGVLSKSFEDMAEALRKADEWKRRLIVDSAHELRTPVALLQGNLEMMREGVYPIDEDHINRLYEETLHLSKLVSELRELADAEGGSSSYTFETVDLFSLMHHLVQTYKADSSTRTLRVGIDDHKVPAGEDAAQKEAAVGEKARYAIYGDRHKLEQAFSNILSNAIRHTPEGGEIRVELASTEQRVDVAIEDSGEGIPPHERENIFERFYRLDSARNRSSGGSGLGLAVTKEIVGGHGGTIRVADNTSRAIDGKPPKGDGKPPKGDGKPPKGDGKPPKGDGESPKGDGKPGGASGTGVRDAAPRLGGARFEISLPRRLRSI